MNGISKRGVLSLGLCDMPEKERFWHVVRNLVGSVVVVGGTLGVGMGLIWWLFG